MESNIKDEDVADENMSKNSDATYDAESKSIVDDATIVSENEEQNDIENGEEIQNDIDNKKQIYEQTNLEDIFQQARKEEGSIFGFQSKISPPNDSTKTQDSSNAM